MSIDRRSFLFLMACAALAPAAAAKDGDSDSGDDGGSGDNSGPGGGDDGGSDNSGPGNSHDDGDDNDNDNDNDNGDDGKETAAGALDQDGALRAVRDGEIIPLNRAIGIVKRRNPGKVIDVSLQRRSFRDVYSFKIKNSAGRVMTLRMNARTGAIIGF